MAAGTWTFYNSFKEFMADGTLDLDGDTFKVSLHSSSYTPSASTHTATSDLTNELSNGNGYTTGGETLTATWTRSGGTVTFDSDDPSWTASGATLTARYAVLYDSTASKLVAYCLLDSTPADVSVTDGNTLTITMNASGIFTLS